MVCVFSKHFLKRIGAVILLGICNLIELFLGFLLQLPKHRFLVIMCLVIYVGYTSTTRHRFMDNHVLSRITQTEFPDFTVLKYEKGQKNFTGDYRGSIVFKLDEPLSEEFIQSIKDLSNISDSHWSISKDSYVYYCLWGMDWPPPPGESKDEEIELKITISKENQMGEIQFCYW